MPGEKRDVEGVPVIGSEGEWRSTKTEAELRVIAGIAKGGAGYQDFPDGVTWADLDAALKLEEQNDAS